MREIQDLKVDKFKAVEKLKRLQSNLNTQNTTVSSFLMMPSKKRLPDIFHSTQVLNYFFSFLEPYQYFKLSSVNWKMYNLS